MQRVNMNQFYILGHTLHVLEDVAKNSTVKQWYYQLRSAKDWLDFLLKDKFLPLGVSKTACTELLTAINTILGQASGTSFSESLLAPTMERQITLLESYRLHTALQTFETVLAAHLQSLNTYFVSQKLAYETSLLIEGAEKLLPEDIQAEVRESIPDLQQAGKCMAFDIPTAAGFHIIRATEAVIRKYYTAVVKKPPKPKMRNWGAYIKKFHEAGADTRVTGFLDHIREEYRNPVLHPEVVLTSEEAHILLGVCISAIVSMVKAMKTMSSANQSS